MPNKGSGDINHPSDENKENHPTQQKREGAIKPLKYIPDMREQTTDANDTSSSSPHTSELEGTTTRKLGDSTTRKLGSEGWKQQQLDDLWQGLGGKRKADTENDLPPKKLRTETAQTLEIKQDIKGIAEVPNKENQPSSSLSQEQKANNRKNELLLMDQMRRLGPRNPLGPIFPRNN